MVTDPIFYQLFTTSPETFFSLLGMSNEIAANTAARYQFQALEFKETSQRVDGVFLPKEDRLPVYFLEVQFYPLPSIFAGLLAKAFTFLKQHDPGQPFRAVVLFAHRRLEPTALEPYQLLLEGGVIQRFYLDEMTQVANAPLGLSILMLIGQSEDQAPSTARQLLVRAKAEIGDESLRADLIELIETIVVYKLPRLGREEVQAMLMVQDIRQTRVYQEAREEGKKEGIEQGRHEGIEQGRHEGIEQGRHEGIEQGIAIAKLAAGNKSIAEIAAALRIDPEFVRQVLAKMK